MTAETVNAVTCWLTKKKEMRKEGQLVCCMHSAGPSRAHYFRPVL